ncbi:MAG: T9SS type A sorting domain-containing protein [Ignavibacteria bacterium]
MNVLEPVGISENNSIANNFELYQNYPNPFNPETKIRFNLNKSSNVSLSIFDATGKVVADLINNKFYTSGDYSVAFNAAQYNLTMEFIFIS